jgi:hypothetical protein
MAVLPCVLALLLATAAEAVPNLLIYGLTSGSQLVTFRSNAPGTILSTQVITGIGAPLVGIDFRPATGQLYALGNTGQLYVIDPLTGAATPVGSPVALTGVRFGFDFNPTVDRIRVVSDANMNIRLVPTNGALAGVDAMLVYAGTDVNVGMDPNVVASAYTNSFPGASLSTGTNLYGIDSALGILVFQNPPNNGVLNTVGSLGLGVLDGIAGFDISPDGRGFAALHLTGALTSNFYTINLETGAATLVGTIGGGTTIMGIAVAATGNRPDQDFDGDGKADIGVFRPTTGEWFILRSSDGGLTQVTFGAPGLGDIPVNADYDGDGRTDFAVFRTSTAEWLIFGSSTGFTAPILFGGLGTGDLPVPADYDADGKTDIAIYRTTTAQWFILRSSDNQVFQITLGQPNVDVPLTLR